ncbi:MAG: RloB family protein [Thiobacillus sp.]
MVRKVSRFDRNEPRFKQQARVLVLCEDTKSGFLYLNEAAHHFRSQAEVDITHCGKNDPLSIVTEAVKRQRHFDTVYCVIDRDQHETFDAALELAAKNTKKIVVIASYPCYEYWLLLHFRKTRKPYVSAGKNSSCSLLMKDLRKEKIMENYAKGASENLFDELIDWLPNARQRAAEVLTAAINDDELNPSTQLHELIERFEQLGTLQLLA